MGTSYDPAFPLGTTVIGKWNKGQYRIEQLLGQGSNGKVYLVKKGKHYFAMKMGFDLVDLQSEANVLHKIRAKKSSNSFLVEVDDFAHRGINYPFYVMKYVKGRHLLEFLQLRGKDWFLLVGKNLLSKLVELHSDGWIFGDVKLENVLVSDYGRVELIDYGGVIHKGDAVKQFTEVYDRGFWGAGSRVADEKYDLFSFAVLCIQAADPTERVAQAQQFLPQNRNIEYLLEIMRANPLCALVAPFLERALKGQILNSSQAYEEWRLLMLDHSPVKRLSDGVKRHLWLYGVFIAAVLLLIVVIFMIWG